MAYEKQNFVDGQVLRAEHLNKIENALADLVDQQNDFEEGLDEINAILETLVNGGT